MVNYERLFEITKQKIFDDIFNYTDITLKNNIHLALLNKGVAVRCMVYNPLLALVLPDNINSYYLFMCSTLPLSNLAHDMTTWGNIEDILNQRKINLDFVTNDNRMIPKKFIYGICDKSGMMIFAINKKAFVKFGSEIDAYIVINVDTDDVGERTVVSHLPGYAPNINDLITTFNSNDKTKCIGFVNGYVIDNELFDSYGDFNNDLYELYVDGNIQFTFDVDLSHRNTYHSTEENLYKDIILIPREYLQDNVYTYDTISLVIMDENGRGVFVPFLPSQSVSQLTHGCIGISSFLIDAAFDKLGVTAGKLRVIVNNFSKSNTHIENGSLTKQLYTLSDAEIMTLLSGSGDYDIGYWLADSMEKRMYAKYLIDIEEMDIYDQSRITNQIECLGYYPFAQLLCKHNGDIKYLEGPLDEIVLQKPPFWNGVNLYPILHLDGNKINQDDYTITQNDDHVYVSFDVPLPIDFSYSILSYDFVLAEESKTRTIVGGEVESLVISKHSGFLHVYIKTDNTVLNIDGTSHPTFSEILVENNSYYSVIEYNDQYIFTFKPAADGNVFIFEWDTVTNINHYPNVDLSDGKTLTFIPQTQDSVTGESVNSLVKNEYEIYLNGRFLVEGIDCCITPLKNNNDIAGYSIVIQNLKFLNDLSSNQIDIFISNRKILSTDTGYVVDGIIPRNSDNEAWIEGISRLFINGKLVPFSAVTQTSTHFEIDSRYTGNGYIYHFINSISTDFYKSYEPFMDGNYFPGRSEISSFFTKDYSYSYPEEILIDYPNRLFSSYLNEVIRRIINNEILVSYIADDNDIIHQLDSVSYLKDFDVMFREDSLLDKRFVDIYPGYLASISISDFDRYLYIKRLVKILLGDDPITDHLTVYTG